MDFIIVNGQIIRKQEAGFNTLFWDEPFVITQKLWFGYGGIPLFHDNVETMKITLNTLKINIPDLLSNEHELFRLTKRMLNKNRFYRSGIITLQVFAGQSETSTVLTSFAFPGFDFPVSDQGIILNFSEFEKFSGNPLNRFLFFNEPNWKFAEARIQDTSFNNSIFINEKGTVCDCISSDIFMIKGKSLFTPSVETGCYTDTLRDHLMKVASNANLKVVESEEVKREDVLQMNEIFLASEELGLQWVLGVENKRFVHQYSVKLHQLLNEYLKKLAQ